MVSSCASCPIRWVLVFAGWKVWESLKTLNCEIMLLFDFLCIGYGHILFVSIRSHLIVLGCISFFLSELAVWCLTLSCSYNQVRQCRTQLQQQAHVCMICHMHHVYILLTLCAAPHKGMDVGRAPIFTSLKCESWPLMPSWEFNSLFTYLGEALHPWLKKNLSYSFHMFCKL